MHMNSFYSAHSEPSLGLIILHTHLFQQPATRLDLTETQITSRQKLTSFHIAQNLSFNSRQVLKIVIILLEFALTTTKKMSSNQGISDRSIKQTWAPFIEGNTDRNIKKTWFPFIEGQNSSVCHHRNCSYNDSQTRSANRPMTTIKVCNDCGKKWNY